MRIGNYHSEHELEYRIESADSRFEEDEIGFYFERDTGDPLISYKMFLTFAEWNKLTNYIGTATYEERLHSLQYNEVEIVFDVHSLDCASLSNPTSLAHQKADIKIRATIDQYLQNGGRVAFSQLEKQFSGVGQIILWSVNQSGEKTLKGKFFIAVNDLARIKVDYYFKSNPNGVDAILSCKNNGARFEVVLLENDNRLPCLKGDKAGVVGEARLVDFSTGPVQTVSFYLPPNKQNGYYALMFKNDEDEKYYLLNLLYEEKFDVLNLGKEEPIQGTLFCPYCGEKLRARKIVGAYEEGSITCTAAELNYILPKVLDKKGERARRTVFCKQDLQYMDGKGVFNPEFMRVLPSEYYDKYVAKIALLGSVRAGKTTYLSRFFGLSNTGSQVLMGLRHLSSSMSHFGISVTPANAPLLEPTAQGVYKFSDRNYYSTNRYYKDRSIDLTTGAFPMATPSGVDCHRYPFILETKKRDNSKNSYIMFYDIPGEDARSKQLKAAVSGECSGIFLFINAIRDIDGNAAVINAIKAANLPKDTPIAVILAKADLVENKFLSNAHVRRCDYFDIDPNIPYEQGIGREILCASMEVKSYLQAESMILDIESEYSNVMYFALSSFDFADSIRQGNDTDNDPGRLKFENATKRMELPFVWMLKQFGLL